MIEGGAITRVVVSPGTMRTVQYRGAVLEVDIKNDGPGDVYINWAGEAAVDGSDCWRLQKGDSYGLRVILQPPVKLNIISQDTATVQIAKVGGW